LNYTEAKDGVKHAVLKNEKITGYTQITQNVTMLGIGTTQT
jgi:hypothetical protein